MVFKDVSSFATVIQVSAVLGLFANSDELLNVEPKIKKLPLVLNSSPLLGMRNK
jgi:hypothetical protein